MRVVICESPDISATGDCVLKKVIPDDTVVSCNCISFVVNFHTYAAFILKENVCPDLEIFCVVSSCFVVMSCIEVTGMVDERNTACCFCTCNGTFVIFFFTPVALAVTAEETVYVVLSHNNAVHFDTL